MSQEENHKILNPARAMERNRIIVIYYFEELHEVMVENNYMKLKCIYNMDEKGCRLTVHQQTVYTNCNSRKVHLVAPKHYHCAMCTCFKSGDLTRVSVQEETLQPRQGK
jgi:hypothetical protein